MKILILDDEQYRLDRYRDLYESQGHKVSFAIRYSDCVLALRSQKWDLVHLDHDLGDSVIKDPFGEVTYRADRYTDSWGNIQLYNGGHIVQEILAPNMPSELRPARIIIHSLNPKGAQMRDDLLRVGIPTTWEPFNLKKKVW